MRLRSLFPDSPGALQMLIFELKASDGFSCKYQRVNADLSNDRLEPKIKFVTSPRIFSSFFGFKRE